MLKASHQLGRGVAVKHSSSVVSDRGGDPERSLAADVRAASSTGYVRVDEDGLAAELLRRITPLAAPPDGDSGPSRNFAPAAEAGRELVATEHSAARSYAGKQ